MVESVKKYKVKRGKGGVSPAAKKNESYNVFFLLFTKYI
jgi:hypothetical protein